MIRCNLRLTELSVFFFVKSGYPAGMVNKIVQEVGKFPRVLQYKDKSKEKSFVTPWIATYGPGFMEVKEKCVEMKHHIAEIRGLEGGGESRDEGDSEGSSQTWFKPNGQAFQTETVGAWKFLQRWYFTLLEKAMHVLPDGSQKRTNQHQRRRSQHQPVEIVRQTMLCMRYNASCAKSHTLAKLCKI